MCDALRELFAKELEERGKPALENSLAQGLKKGKAESIIDLISESGSVPEAVLDLVYAQQDAEALTSCLKPATKSDSMKSFLKNLPPAQKEKNQ